MIFYDSTKNERQKERTSKVMKKWINSFKISFSMYSKIPMPQSEWTKENMRYVMCFFPCIEVDYRSVDSTLADSTKTSAG